MKSTLTTLLIATVVNCSLAATTYQHLQTILNRYERPITALIIDDTQEHLAHAIVHDYDASCVMVERKESLRILCDLNDTINNRIVFLQTQLTADELVRMSKREHFDVVLAFNIIHHFGSEWKKAANALLALGDTIIMETPPEDDTGACGYQYIKAIEQYIIAKGGTVIGRCPRHTSNTIANVYLLENPRRKNTEKGLITHETFEELNGIYPSRSFFKNRLEKKPSLDAMEVKADFDLADISLDLGGCAF